MNKFKTDWSELKKTNSYRHFLREYLKAKSMTPADFARLANCHRGFPADVISGKRRLTAKSFYSFEKALRAPHAAKKMFRLLVALSENDVLTEIDRSKIPSQLEHIQHMSWKKERTSTGEIGSTLQKLLKDFNVPLVFAATGEPETGASFDEIKMRTQIESKILKRTLDLMVLANLLKYENDKYQSKELHIFFKSLDKDQVMSGLFGQYCLAAREKAKHSWNLADHLFFFSNLCIRQSQLAELKSKLREVLLSFVDDNIEPHGDRIVKVTASMFI